MHASMTAMVVGLGTSCSRGTYFPPLLSFRRLSFSWRGRVTSSANAQEELNHLEQRMEQMTARNDDLAASVDTLGSELITSYEDAQRASQDLETMRGRGLHVTPRRSSSASGS